jgi:hypothetical protein
MSEYVTVYCVLWHSALHFLRLSLLTIHDYGAILHPRSLWRYMAAYFPAKLVRTQALEPSKNYIFVMQPHG